MFLIVTLLAAAGAEPPPIIVTAKPQTAKALAECLARKCGTREDAVASIHHAQAQFADGEYPDARKTLLASLARNRGQDNADPRAMSALWHALARVTLHNGDLQEYRRAALRSGSILARADTVTKSEQVRGEVQIADALSMTGDPDGAVRRYRAVGRDARTRGDVELAEMMELRAVYARSTFDGRPAARRKLERAAEDAALTPRARMAARGLAAQLQDRPGKVQALLDDVPVQSADAPLLLLRTPQSVLGKQREAVNRALANDDWVLFTMLQPRGGEARPYSWADIGFWVRPDGSVQEAEVLRGSRNLSWTKDVLRTVQGRRYAPFAAEAGSEGRYKIERVTLTYEHQTPAGSLIRRRSGLPSYRFEELKIENGSTTSP
jgi:hypothetical protein